MITTQQKSENLGTAKPIRLGIYFTLGDFGLEESVAILKGAAEGGASLLEVGLPFSDPLLDGPVVQASHSRALKRGEISWSQISTAVGQLKNAVPNLQISLMTSAQLLYLKDRTLKLPSVDGFLVTDISYNLKSPVSLPSPRVWFLSQEVALKPNFSAPPEEISMVYLTRVQGITGENQKAEQTTHEAISAIRKKTDKPIWLGFGITNAADVRQCAEQGADGAIVGSAFVKAMEAAEAKVAREAQTDRRCAELKEAARVWVSELLNG